MVSSDAQRANAISASGECIPSSHQEQSLSAAFQQTDTTLSSLEAETVVAPSGDAISSVSFQEGDDVLSVKQDANIHSLFDEQYNTQSSMDQNATASSFAAKTPTAPR
jgi:hypothetical protein